MSLRSKLQEAVTARTAASVEDLKELKEQFRLLLRRQHQEEHSRLMDLERKSKVTVTCAAW